MIQTEASTIIDAPPEKVWGYISDLGTWTEWDPDALKVNGALSHCEKCRNGYGSSVRRCS